MELVWKASSRMAKVLCWLGLQDATRKRRRSTQRPGAWSGAVVSLDNGKVTKAVTQERWEKVQSKIRWIAKEIGVEEKFTPTEFKDIYEEFSSKVKGKIHFKTTDRLVGFIVYVCQTYDQLKPYLKGIYLTLNKWRNGRDEEGWLTDEAKRQAKLGIKPKDGDPLTWVDVVP